MRTFKVEEKHMQRFGSEGVHSGSEGLPRAVERAPKEP